MAQAQAPTGSTSQAQTDSKLRQTFKGEAASEDEDLPQAKIDELLSSISEPQSYMKSGYQIDRESAFGAISDGMELVYLPLKGDSLVAPSKLAFIFQDGKLTTYMEMAFVQKSETSGHVKAWTDGKLVADKEISESGAPIEARGMSWGKLNDCLASMGISAWVLAGISAVCGVACLGTAGAGCAACVAAFAGVGAGSVTHCVREAWE